MKVALELDTRSKLLQAAVKVFAVEGFAGASVRQIADLAGVNHGSIKYHYSSKNQLWRATTAFLFEALEAFIFEGSDKWDQLSEREQLIQHIERYARFNAQNPELMRIVMFESLTRSERFEWLSENYLRPFSDRAINRTALAQEQGLFRQDIPALNLYYMQISASRSMLFAATELNERFGIDMTAEEEIRRHVDAMVKMFVLPEDGLER